ncbi:hypothetical protein [Pseudonocardia sp. DLS-67]
MAVLDGHDRAAVERELAAARALRRPVVVHCVTVKGKGHRPAEEDPVDRMHTVSPAAGVPGAGWSEVFGTELCAIGRERDDVVALTAAMLHPTGLAPFAAAFPQRVFDVGTARAGCCSCRSAPVPRRRALRAAASGGRRR